MWISKGRDQVSGVRCQGQVSRLGRGRPPVALRLSTKLPRASDNARSRRVGLCRLRPALRFLKPDTWHLKPILAAFCILLSVFCFSASGLYEIRELKPNIFVWIPEDVLDQDGDPEFNRAGTAGFIITRGAVIVVDTTNTPVHARELLYEIRRRTELPIKAVINTDANGDHFLGNEVFADLEATIYSTAAAQAEMRRYQQELRARLEDDWRMQARMRGIHLRLPGQTFQGEIPLLVPDQEIKLVAPGRGKSQGGAIVFLPRAKVAFLGDLFENKFFPRIDSNDVREWIEILRQLESWDVEAYVPGHGSPGDKKDLAEFRRFLEWLLSEVETRIQQGEALTQVKNELLPFQNYHWAAPELETSAVEAVYKQLAGAAHPTSPAQTSSPSTAKSTDH